MMEHENQFEIRLMSEVLGVSRSGYYAWRDRDDSKRDAEDLRLIRKIEDIHNASRGSYGSPRVLAQLKALGFSCGKTKVERLMKKHGIRAKTKRKFKVTTDSKHHFPLAKNILNRDFSPSKPDKVWAGDITYISVNGEWLFLAVVIDLFSRKVVGWSMSDDLKTDLALAALRMAYFRRKPAPNLIFHSDRGSQYSCEKFRIALKTFRMIQSQSRKGNCWDNSPVESFFHSLKTELVYQEKFTSRSEAERKIFEWIEVFYNRQRLHSTLNYKSPVDYEVAECQ